MAAVIPETSRSGTGIVSVDKLALFSSILGAGGAVIAAESGSMSAASPVSIGGKGETGGEEDPVCGRMAAIRARVG
jgi:hypothetical protein